MNFWMYRRARRKHGELQHVVNVEMDCCLTFFFFAHFLRTVHGGQALTLNPASPLSSQHGANGAKPTPSSRARHAAASWFSQSRQEAAGALNPQPSCGSSRKHAPRARTLPSARLCVRPTCPAGVASSLWQRSGPLPAPCSSSSSRQLEPLPACMKSCRMQGGSTPRLPAASPRGLRQP